VQLSSSRHLAARHGRHEKQQLAKARPAQLFSSVCLCGAVRAVRRRHLWACTVRDALTLPFQA